MQPGRSSRSRTTLGYLTDEVAESAVEISSETGVHKEDTGLPTVQQLFLAYDKALRRNRESSYVPKTVTV